MRAAIREKVVDVLSAITGATVFNQRYVSLSPASFPAIVVKTIDQDGETYKPENVQKRVCRVRIELYESGLEVHEADTAATPVIEKLEAVMDSVEALLSRDRNTLDNLTSGVNTLYRFEYTGDMIEKHSPVERTDSVILRGVINYAATYHKILS